MLSLIKVGTGTLTLTGANSYDGLTTVSAGILNIQNATGLGTTNGSTTVSSGATLQIQGVSIGNETLTLRGAGAAGQNGALVNVSGTDNYGGLVVLAAASTISSDSGTFNLTNTGTITGPTFGLTLAGAGNGSISSIIGTTTGTLTKNGIGTWTLSGTAANTYTGVTTVNEGELDLSKTAGVAAIAGNLVIGDGTATDTIKLINSDQIADTSDVTINSSGVFNLNGKNETIDALNSGSSTASITLGAGVLTVGANNEASAAFAGVISGTGGSLIKSGTGTQTLSGNDTYTGGTTIIAGTIGIGSDTALGSGTLALGGSSASTPTILASGGPRTIANNISLAAVASGNATIGGSNDLTLNGTLLNNGASRTLTINNAGDTTQDGNVFLSETAGTGRTLTLNGSGTFLIAGVIANNSTTNVGAGSLTYSGTGALTLSGANTYSGTTTLSSGTINVNSATAFGTSSSVAINGVTLDNTSGASITIANNNPYTLGGNNIFTGTNDLNLGTGAMSLNGGTRTWTVNGGDLTIGGVISGSAGNGLTKSGVGTLTLGGSAANTYNGATTVNDGRLELNKTAAVNAFGGSLVHRRWHWFGQQRGGSRDPGIPGNVDCDGRFHPERRFVRAQRQQPNDWGFEHDSGERDHGRRNADRGQRCNGTG